MTFKAILLDKTGGWLVGWLLAEVLDLMDKLLSRFIDSNLFAAEVFESRAIG